MGWEGGACKGGANGRGGRAFGTGWSSFLWAGLKWWAGPGGGWHPVGWARFVIGWPGDVVGPMRCVGWAGPIWVGGAYGGVGAGVEPWVGLTQVQPICISFAYRFAGGSLFWVCWCMLICMLICILIRVLDSFVPTAEQGLPPSPPAPTPQAPPPAVAPPTVSANPHWMMPIGRGGA